MNNQAMNFCLPTLEIPDSFSLAADEPEGGT